MAVDGDGAGGGGPAVFKPLPGRPGFEAEAYATYLADVVRSLGLDVGEEPDLWTRGQVVRAAIRDVCRRGITLTAESFDVLLRAAVVEPDPSFDRWFVEPALNAFGRRRVRLRLLGYLRTGSNPERAGAARAWYWSALPLTMPEVRARHPEQDPPEPEPGGGPTVVAEWNAAALREFVGNEDLDVRRCVLPGLPLRKSAFPPDAHHLVDAAVAIARSHPDDCIRHRVEHQVGD